MDDKLTQYDIEKVFANPFYAITVHPNYSQPHEPMIEPKMWVEVGVKAIKEMGAEKYLTILLANLQSGEVPLGYKEK